MGLRKPTALKMLEGTVRADRANPAEPKPAIGAKPPPWLPRRGPAWTAWNRLARVLSDVRVLTVADAEALGLGCMALAEFLAFRDDPVGWRRAEGAWKRYLAVLREFGLTPAARTKVAAVPAVENDPLAEWEASGPPPYTPPTPPKPPKPAKPPKPTADADDADDAMDRWLADA